MFAYPNTLKHYVDLFWNCGSTVGAGRGSACAALNHYLLGITQLDPTNGIYHSGVTLTMNVLSQVILILTWHRLKFRRFSPKSARKEENFGLIQVCTFRHRRYRKPAILTACRGYRSEEYPDGIDVDEAQYLSSLIPQERGFLWPIEDVVNGNQEKGRKPVKAFVTAVSQYDGLLDILFVFKACE